MSDSTTRQIGKYQIQAELGRGGFGTVYRAYDPTVGRLVAIKVLTAAPDDSLLSRFRNEAAAAGNLHHKNIVTIYDFGEHEGLPYIAMEFLEGEDLQQVIANRTSLSLLDKVSIMLQVADGLHCAHRAGVVHRDVKPQNVRLLPDGTIKIMDFGIARLVADSEGTRLTRQGHVIGTLLYMAPEQVLGGEADFLCDIFAYGTTYYQLLAGKHPFDAANPRAIFYKLTVQDPEPIRNLVPECPEALERIISRALHKDRELRYQSLREVQFDTEPILIELRQDRAISLVTTANELYDAGQLDNAQDILNEAFDLDPANRAARDLRERIQNERLQQLIQPKVQVLLASGDEAVANRQFEQAISIFENALRLDRDKAEIQQKLAKARNLLELSHEATRLIAEARRHIAKNNLDAALRILPETLELDPQNVDAQQLFEEVRKEIARREKQRQRNEVVRQAKHWLQENRFDDAKTLLGELDDEYRDHADVQSLLAQIRDKKQAYERQQALQQELTAIRELLGSSRFDPAVARLEALRIAHPEAPEPIKLLVIAHRELAAQQHREAVQRVEVQLAGLVKERRFEEALSAVEETLAHFPGDERLLALRRETKTGWELEKRHRAVAEALQQSRERLGERQPEAAVELLEATLRRHPGNDQLVSALATARSALEAKQRDEAIESLRRDVQAQVAAREFDRAISAVDRGLRGYGDDSRLKELRNWALSAQAVHQAVTESRQRLEQGQPEAAVQLLERVLERYPGDAQLVPALGAAREALENKRRDEAIESLRRDVQAQVAAREFDRAISTADRGLRDYGDDHRLKELRDSVLSAQAVHQAVTESRRQLEQGQPEAAVELLEATLRRHPGNEQLVSALATAWRAREAKQREEAIESLRRDVQAQIAAAREFDPAIAAVDRGLRDYGDDHRLKELRDWVLSAQAIHQAVIESRRQLEQGQPEAAVELLQATLQRHPDDEQLVSVLAEARETLATKRRDEAIQTLCRDVQAQVAAGEFDGAVDALNQALREYGSDGRLTDLRDWVLSAQAVTESRRQLDLGRPEAAVELLETALRRRASDEQLVSALAEAREALEIKWRDEAVETLRNAVQAHVAAREFDRAIAALDEGLREYGNDHRLNELCDAVLSVQAVHEAIAESQRQLEQGQPEAAAKLLEAALQQHDGDEQLASALRTVQTALGAKQRDEAIESLCREVQAQMAASDFTRAIGAADRGLREYGNDHRLKDLRESALSARAVHQVVVEADLQVTQGQPNAAVELLEAALQRHPADEHLISALASAREALETKQRDEAIESLCRETHVYIKNQEFSLALEKLERGLQVHGRDHRLNELRNAVLSAKADWERDTAIKGILESSRRHMEDQQPEAAIELLESALAQYPDERQLVDALSGIRDWLEERDRETAIAALNRRVGRHFKNREFTRAIDLIDEGLNIYPGEKRLITLRETVAAAKAEWERAENVAQALTAAAELRREHRFVEALDILNHQLRQFPDEPRLLKSQGDIQVDWERHEHCESARRVIRDCERLIAGGDLDRAAELLAAASPQYADEPEIADAFSGARQILETRVMDRAIDQTCRDAQVRLQTRDFIPALTILERALETYGPDDRLTQMRAVVISKKAEWERAEDIRRVIASAREDISQGRPEKAVEALEPVLMKYENDAAVAQTLGDARAALERARKEREIDKANRQAEAHVKLREFDKALHAISQAEQAYGDDPRWRKLRDSVTAAKKSLEQQSKRIRKALDRARASMQAGKPQDAVGILESALREDAGESELIRALSEAKIAVDVRHQAVADICRHVRAFIASGDYARAHEALSDGMRAYGPDEQLTRLQQELPNVIAEPHAIQATAIFTSPAEVKNEQAGIADHVPPIEATPSVEEPVAGSETEALPRREKRPSEPPLHKQQWFRRVAAALLLIGPVVFVLGMLTSGEDTVALQVRSSPATAVIRVADRTCTGLECRFELRQGEYQVEASADGFESAVQKVVVDTRKPPAPISITLRPLRPTVQVVTNFTEGQVALDGRQAGQLQGGQLVAEGLEAGTHNLRISSGGEGAGAAVQFQTDYGKVPVLERVSAENADAIAVGIFANQAVISSTFAKGKVTVDDRAVGELENGRITVRDVGPGTHQIRLVGDGVERNLTFMVGKTPAISVSVTSNRNFGVLVVETNEDDVTVFIDGRRYPRLTRRGQLRLSLDAKQHSIRVAKNGYRTEPAEFRGELAKGAELRAQFKVLPEFARLNISGHIPGTSILLDAKPMGTIGADGTLSAQVPPGEHRVGFRKEGYSPAEFRRVFTPGRTVTMTRADAPLAPEVVAAKPVVTAPQPQPTPPPAPPDPKAIELAEWQRVAKSRSAADFDEFLKKHPNGTFSREAAGMLERIRWDVVDKQSRTALQEYLNRYPNSPFTSQARTELARLENQEQRQQELQRQSADRQLILDVLRGYAAAYGEMNISQLVALRPALSKPELETLKRVFRDFRVVRLELRPTSEPEISGTTAQVRCVRITDSVDQTGSHPAQNVVVVKLSKKSGKWVIDSMDQ